MLDNFYAKIRRFFLDTLFPVKCLGCQRENIWLCGQCLEKIPPKTEQVCPWCEAHPTPGGRTCFTCRTKSPLDGLVTAASYRQKIVAKLVHYYKYRYIEELARPLGEIMVRAYLASELPLPDLILPVPLHPRRLRWRGFNQSIMLADFLGENITPGYKLPVFDNFLIRARNTHPQMKVKNYSLRKKNVQEAFSLNEKNKSDINYDNNKCQIKDKVILLVDDIATTGATLFECARLLKKNGAKEVIGIVVARQEIKSG